MLNTLELPQKIRIEGAGLEHKAAATAQSFFPANSVIYEVSDFLSFTTHTYQTVQVSENVHILDTVLSHLNHSCAPNTFIDCKNLKLVAEKNISKGDELNFFYPSTEWTMSSEFDCDCGSKRCLGKIVGACSLSDSILQQYKVNDHIRSLSLSSAGLLAK